MVKKQGVQKAPQPPEPTIPPHNSLVAALSGFCTKHGVLVDDAVRAFRRDKIVARTIGDEVSSFRELSLAEQEKACLTGPTLLVRYEGLVTRYVELRPYKRMGVPALAPFVDFFNTKRREGKGEISDGNFGRPMDGDGRYQSGHYDETRLKD